MLKKDFEFKGVEMQQLLKDISVTHKRQKNSNSVSMSELPASFATFIQWNSTVHPEKVENRAETADPMR